MKIIKYILIFLVFLFSLVFAYNIFFGDSIVNYGFSYALTMKEIPYKDFNMILPLFSPFIYMIPLLIYNSSITFYITQSLLLTILFYLLEKKLSYKVYLFFLIVAFSIPLFLISGLFPGYNFILFLLIILIINLEENNKSDILIGILIGCAIITKHTIGIFLIIPSIIFYYKDIKKLLIRLGSLLIPIFIFLIYLIITKSLSSFIDLAILGLFDFANKNNNSNNIFLIIITIISLIYIIYAIIKDNEISKYYLLLTILYIIPLLDSYHLSYFIYATMYIFLTRININKNKKIPFIILTIIIISIWTTLTLNYKDYKYYNYDKYPLRYMSKAMRNDYSYIDSFIKKNDKEVILFLLGTENYFYKINNNQKITYFDLTNYGNYGYNGYSKMKKKIDSYHDAYFIISTVTLNNNSNNQQYYKELANYIKEKGKKIDNNIDYCIYYFE